MADTCPCGIHPADCTYHRPDLVAAMRAAETISLTCWPAFPYEVGDRVGLVIGGVDRCGTVTEVAPGAITVVLDAHVTDVSVSGVLRV